MTATILTWRKSSYSGTQSECVEVAHRGAVLLRNSNAPDAGTLAVPAGAFGALLAGVRAGALDDVTG